MLKVVLSEHHASDNNNYYALIHLNLNSYHATFISLLRDRVVLFFHLAHGTRTLLILSYHFLTSIEYNINVTLKYNIFYFHILYL